MFNSFSDVAPQKEKNMYVPQTTSLRCGSSRGMDINVYSRETDPTELKTICLRPEAAILGGVNAGDLMIKGNVFTTWS